MLIEEAVKLAKEQIRQDIASGVVPSGVRTFAELHDYVDANEYGGLCDMAMDVQNRDEDDDPSDQFVMFCNRVQNALNEWLEGRTSETEDS